eukprot:UN15423
MDFAFYQDSNGAPQCPQDYDERCDAYFPDFETLMFVMRGA